LATSAYTQQREVFVRLQLLVLLILVFEVTRAHRLRSRTQRVQVQRIQQPAGTTHRMLRATDNPFDLQVNVSLQRGVLGDVYQLLLLLLCIHTLRRCAGFAAAMLQQQLS
jgi:hypothetical protein